jgi:hypothetical protein
VQNAIVQQNYEKMTEDKKEGGGSNETVVSQFVSRLTKKQDKPCTHDNEEGVEGAEGAPPEEPAGK